MSYRFVNNIMAGADGETCPAGSVGGMCGAIVTSPFDVVKTRLQSDLFREKHATVGLATDGAMVIQRRPNLLWHFVETGHILRCVLRAHALTTY